MVFMGFLSGLFRFYIFLKEKKGCWIFRAEVGSHLLVVAVPRHDCVFLHKHILTHSYNRVGIVACNMIRLQGITGNCMYFKELCFIFFFIILPKNSSFECSHLVIAWRVRFLFVWISRLVWDSGSSADPDNQTCIIL